jgi:hypothetical protein
MADKDKSDKKGEAHEERKSSKQETAAQLLSSYIHNMEHAAPRSLEELKLVQELAAVK